MPEQRSALASAYKPGALGTETDPTPVVIWERTSRNLVQVSGWPGTFAAVCDTLGRMLSPAPPADCLTVASGDGRTIFRVGPERLWIAGDIADDALQSLDEPVFGGEAVLTEIGHSRTVLRLCGPAAPTLLNRGLPIDLDEGAFPPDAFAQSVMHHIPVLVHRVPSDGDPTFDVYVSREYALSFWTWLIDEAAALGCRIKEPQ